MKKPPHELTCGTELRRSQQELRRQAEEHVRKIAPPSISAQTPEEIQRAFHELQVQKIELEMQNEELRLAQAGEALRFSERFLRSTLDGLSAHIAVLDEEGQIILTNQAYRNFGQRNGLDPGVFCEGANYLAVCDTAKGGYSEEANPFAEGIRDVLSGKCESFELDYPCHSPEDQRWFRGRVTPLNYEGPRRVIVAHENITEHKQAENQLKESEEKFKSLMQQSPFVVELYDLKGLQISVNKAYEELWEFPAETTLNKFNVLESKEVEETGLLEYVKRAYAGDSIVVPEYVFDPSGDTEAKGVGRRRWLNTRIYPLKDESGKVKNIVIVHQDITERKQAEDALRMSKELLSETESIGKVGGWSFHADTLAQAWTDEVYHIHEVEIRPNPGVEVGINYYTKESRPIIEKAVQRAIEHGEGFDLELEIITAKGNRRAVHTIGKADLKNRRVYGFFQDITERKQAEEVNRLLSSILKTSKDFIGIASPDGQASYVNPAGMAMVGIDSDEALKQTFVDDYFFPEDLPFVHEVIIPTLHKEGRWAGEFRFRHFKTGEPVPVNCDLFLTEDPSTGEVQNISTISRDISIRKRLQREQERMLEELKVEKEAAESANRAKDEFLAVMSHEMRTPLNPILGFSVLLLNQCDSNETRDALQCIINAGERQLRLIDDILSYSRLDRRTLHPVHSQFSLLSACESALQDSRPASHGLELIFTNGLPDWKPLPSDLKVKADSSMLAQLLGNLLGNACKYTKQGRIVLKVGMENSSACPRRFHFRIEDTGIGISKEDAARLFKPFTQVDSSYTRSFDGAGLGLAICKKMIDLLGGDIGLESEPGKGASFWFTLPLETIDPPPRIDSKKISGPAFVPRAMRLHLLVVDDHPDNAKIAVAMAEHLGNRCVSCQNGLDALRICSEQSFDAILLDLAMPGTSGFETLRLLRDAPGPNRHTPVIAVTADASDTVQERCLAAGMVGYISKPIRREKLFEVLNAVVVPAT